AGEGGSRPTRKESQPLFLEKCQIGEIFLQTLMKLGFQTSVSRGPGIVADQVARFLARFSNDFHPSTQINLVSPRQISRFQSSQIRAEYLAMRVTLPSGRQGAVQ
ncbi:hypothetical protein, partial [Aliiroseovarius zhejiangensis]|uniref:hypothetical protein n=1 Tax=Aliiroseovarius zhejiangensis TaxID=1632025 RepID=UPI001E2E01BC